MEKLPPSFDFSQPSGMVWKNGAVLTAQQLQQLDNAKINTSRIGVANGVAPLDANAMMSVPVSGDVSGAKINSQTVTEVAAKANNSVQKDDANLANGYAKLDGSGRVTVPVTGSVADAPANAAGDTVSSIADKVNKTWMQASALGSGLAQFLVDNLNVDVTDADTPATFSSRIANAILKLAQISPFNQSFAAAIGGYRKYAIVSDSSGNFWVSTADQNVTVPGASGAKWQNLFNGYATEAWANGQFLKLADSAEQTVSGPVTFSGLTVIPKVTDWTTRQSVGASDADARYLAKSLATLQSVTGPVAFGGRTQVPSISDFTGLDALNAVTADGRYPASVPTAGQARITSLVQDANGRAVSNGTVLANLADIPSFFVSAPQVIQENIIYSIPHNLGRAPVAWGIRLICVRPEYGYIKGQQTEFLMNDNHTSEFYRPSVSELNGNLIFPSGDSTFTVLNITAGGNADYLYPSAGSWQFIFWAM